MSGFHSAPLESLIDALIDYRGKTPPKSSKGIRLVTAKCIKGGTITNEPREYISEETYRTWMRRGLPEPGDVLVTTEAPLGEVARVPPDEPIALAQRVILLRSKPELFDIDFLYCVMRSPLVRERLRQRSSGTTVSGIRQSELRKVDLPHPPLAVQRRIADVITAFDELIENNRRRIEILEEATRLLYREWFLLFRFPSYDSAKFIESPFGQIPHDWTAGSLSQLAVLQRTNINPTRFPNEIFAHCSIPAFDTSQTPVLEQGNAVKSGKYLIRDQVVLVSKLNPRIRRVWLTGPNPNYRMICSTEFLPLASITRPWTAFLYGLATSEPFATAIASLAGGTSTSHQRAKPDDFLALPVVIPDEKSAFAYGARVMPMLELAGSLRAYDRVLAAARDCLLPKLVTGKIDVDSLGVDDVFGWAEMAGAVA